MCRPLRPHENGSSLEGRGGAGRRGVLGSSSEDVVAAGASVRTTRASRLRQAALTSPNANNNNNNTNSNNNNNNSSGNNNNSFNSNNNNNANPVQELKDTGTCFVILPFIHDEGKDGELK